MVEEAGIAIEAECRSSGRLPAQHDDPVATNDERWSPEPRAAAAAKETIEKEGPTAEAEGWSTDRLLADHNDPAAAEGVYKTEWELDISERRQTLSQEPGALLRLLRDKKLAWLNPQPDQESATTTTPANTTGRGAAICQGARSILAAEPATQPKRWTDLELCGVALSGGGIRSATFNLGVLQALRKHGLLRHVDYLSTVSGGGYVGSSYAAWMAQAAALPDTDASAFPFKHVRGRPERAEMRHLRQYANYLAPRGFMDRVKFPWLLLRGIAINLLLVSPMLAAAALATVLLIGWKIAGLPEVGEACIDPWWMPFGCPFALTKTAAIPAAAAFIAYPIAIRIAVARGIDNWSNRDRANTLAAILIMALVLAFAVELQPAAAALSLQLVSTAREWSFGGFLSWVLGVMGSLSAGFAFLRGFPLAMRIAKRLAVYVVGLTAPAVLYVLYLWLCLYLVGHLWFDDEATRVWSFGVHWPRFFAVLAVAVLVFLFCRSFVDINRTSLHRFYRDRLSKAYLFGARKDSDPIGAELPHLDKTSLAARGTCAPYHLVNAAVSLAQESDDRLRGRRADFFLFSRRFCGSRRVGYCDTDRLATVDANVDLGTAMAISGAAVDPNMGRNTNRVLKFLLGMLNLRLGYWLPNPRLLQANHWKVATRQGRFIYRLGLWQFFYELFGKMDAGNSFVHVTDGGHIENLGLHELLRRRCKIIIASDAEQDAKLSFNGLATAIRLARIDMGIDVDIDLDAIRPLADGETKLAWSRRHYAVGSIDYGPDGKGLLLYIKSSMTGDENEYIREYKTQHPDFPHEATSDQFFDEAQFECYRALGYHAADGLLLGRDWTQVVKSA